MGVHVTSAGKVKVSLALDPHAYELLKQMSAGPRAVGSLLGELIQAEAARRSGGLPGPAPAVDDGLSTGRRLETVALPHPDPGRHRPGERLRILHEIDRAILEARSPGEIAQVAAEGVLRVTDAARVVVASWQPLGENFEVLAWAGLAHPHLRVGMSMAFAPWTWLANVRRGEIALTEELDGHPDLTSEGVLAFTQGIRSHAAIPLMVRGQSIGHLDISRTVPGRLPDEDLAVAQQIADSLAVALHNARLHMEVQARQCQLQSLSRRLVEVQEEERRGLSRELHDETGQAITALKLGLSLLKREPASTGAMQEKLDELRAIADEVADSLHRLALNLRPSSLDRYGLIPALEGYIAAYEKQAGLAVEFLANGYQDERLPSGLETALYRIVQEALTNVARHAQARHVDVLLERHQDRVSLIVEDDGIGFDVAEALQSGRLGLLGMRERAEMLGGTLAIESRPGGTTLYVDLPVLTEEAEPAANLSSPALVVVDFAKDGRAEAAPPVVAEAELARAKVLGDALNDWHDEIAGLQDPELILERAVMRAGEALGSEVATVAVRDEAEWVLRSGYRLNPMFVGRRYTEKEIPQYLAHAAASGQVLAVDDTARDARFAPAEADKFSLRAVLVVPFSVDGRVIGCLGFNEYAGPRYYTPAELQFALRLKTSLSLALENARLRQAEIRRRDELARRVEELQTLLEILPVGVAIAYDPACQDIRVNPAMARMLGMPPGSNVSLSAGEAEREAHYRVFAPDGCELQPEELPVQRAAQGVPVRDAVVDVLREDGTEATLLTSAVPLQARDGQVRGAVAAFMDITERRAAETERERLLEEIRQQHELLEHIMAASPVAMCVLRGAAQACQAANPAFAALAGRPLGELLGHPIAQVFPALQEAARPLLAQAYVNGQAVRLREEFYALGSDRRETYWDVAFVPLHDHTGAVDGILLFASQVTDQVLARLHIGALADEARQQAEELNAVLGAIADGLVIYDATGAIARANRAAETMLGYPQAEGSGEIGQRARRVQPLHASGEPYRVDEYPAVRALRGETVQGSIMALRRPEGTVWVSASAAPILGAQGTPRGAVATFTDITRLRETQHHLEETYQELEVTSEELQSQTEELAGLNQQLAEALDRVRRSEATYRAIARGFPNGAVVVLDQDLRYLVADGEALAALGLSSAAMVGRTIRETFPAETAALLEPRYRAALLGDSLHDDTTYEGRSFAVEYRPIRDENNHVVAALGVSRDVTERVALERQLREANRRLQIQAEALSQREAALRVAAETLEQRVQERTADLAAANTRLLEREATLQYQAMLLENVDDAIIGMDAGLYIRTLNRAAEEYYGWPAGEAIGRHLTEITRSHLPPEEREAAMRALAENGHWRGEAIHLRRDSSPFWVEGNVIALRDAGGAITGYAAVNRDTTRRREAEEAVRRQKEHLEILHQIERSVLAARAPAEIAQAAIEAVRQVAAAQRASVVVCDYAAGLGEILADAGVSAAGYSSRARVPLAEYLMLDELRAGRVVIIEDFAALPDATPWKEMTLQAGIRSATLVPLVAGEDVIGILTISRAEPGALPADTRILAVQMADSLALAIHNSRLREQLEAGREQLQALSRRLVGVQERERRYVADQLYNEAGQVLAALRMHLGRSGSGEAGAGYLAETQYLLDRVMLDLHHLATDLRPATLDRLGLVHALQQYAAEWGREHSLEVQFEALGLEGPRPDGEIETAVYRVVQEALMNVALHARATSVGIALSSVEGRLAVTIEDDGVGFEPAVAAAQGALGLLGMRERVEAVGGRLAIEGAPNLGTTVYIEVPVQGNARQ